MIVEDTYDCSGSSPTDGSSEEETGETTDDEADGESFRPRLVATIMISAAAVALS